MEASYIVLRKTARVAISDPIGFVLLEAARIPRPLGGGDEWPHNELCARWGAPCQQSFPGAPPHTPPR